MQSRVFYFQGHAKRMSIPLDYDLERAFSARTPEGILRYYVFDGKQWRKTFYVLIRQLDGRYRVYYRDRRQFSGRKLLQSLANCYNCKPVKVISEDELPLLMEDRHIDQMKEADKWMPHVEPAAEVTVIV